MSNLRRPAAAEYAPYYDTYVSKIEGVDFLEKLKTHQKSTSEYLSNLTEEQWNHRYAEGKWSTKEVMIHLLDTERVFAYRAMRIARNDKTALPGYEQDDYVPYYNAENRTSQSIMDEYHAVRNSTINLFKNFTKEDLDRLGTASGYTFSTLALGFIIAGHETHHMKLFKERYFN